jgi:hypothetical protein
MISPMERPVRFAASRAAASKESSMVNVVRISVMKLGIDATMFKHQMPFPSLRLQSFHDGRDVETIFG